MLDYPVRAIVLYQQVNNDYTTLLNEEQELYPELYFNDLTVQHITSETGFVTEQFTAMGAYQSIGTQGVNPGYAIVTQPYLDSFSL